MCGRWSVRRETICLRSRERGLRRLDEEENKDVAVEGIIVNERRTIEKVYGWGVSESEW